MLSLVLGSATHSFELMLSAFILGSRAGSSPCDPAPGCDRIADPLRPSGSSSGDGPLGAGHAAPLRGVVRLDGRLLATFARTDAGYARLHAWRATRSASSIMLPATFCAGMTLPLITRTLMRGGHGERAIGGVYAINTLGSITGVVLGGLVLLPLIGLKAMLLWARRSTWPSECCCSAPADAPEAGDSGYALATPPPRGSRPGGGR